MNRSISLLLSLLVLVALAAAADVTGKWVAQVPGRDGQMREVTFNLKADGNTLTGTVTTPRGETEISDGKINGDEISFSQVMQFGERKMTMLYKGKVSGDEIKFTRQVEGMNRQAEFTAKRAS